MNEVNPTRDYAAAVANIADAVDLARPFGSLADQLAAIAATLRKGAAAAPAFAAQIEGTAGGLEMMVVPLLRATAKRTGEEVTG